MALDWRETCSSHTPEGRKFSAEQNLPSRLRGTWTVPLPRVPPTPSPVPPPHQPLSLNLTPPPPPPATKVGPGRDRGMAVLAPVLICHLWNHSRPRCQIAALLLGAHLHQPCLKGMWNNGQQIVHPENTKWFSWTQKGHFYGSTWRSLISPFDAWIRFTQTQFILALIELPHPERSCGSESKNRTEQNQNHSQVEGVLNQRNSPILWHHLPYISFLYGKERFWIYPHIGF